MEIIQGMKECSSQYANPDTIMGYGIPDFRKLLYRLNPNLFEYTNKLVCSPNPFSNTLELQFESIPEGKVQLSIYDLFGQKVFDKQLFVNNEEPNDISFGDLFFLVRGYYIIQIQSASKMLRTAILKME
jgi:serine protease AprX